MTDFPMCWGDTETGSLIDLKTCGGYRYAEDPSTHLQLFSYALGDGEVKLWDKHSGEPMPEDLHEYLHNPSYIWTFHNAQFDRLILRHCLKLDMPIRRFRCSMAQALSHALPGSLEKCGEVLNIREDARKIKDGKRLMMLFCKPQKKKDGSIEWKTPFTHPEEWERYKEYAITDTAAMREITKKLPKWNYPRENELELWFLDQEINDRGLYVDMEFVDASVREIEIEKKHLAARTQEITENEVKAASQRDAVLKYVFSAFGIELPNLQKATLEKLIKDDELPENLRELLEVRLSTCTSSTAKYKRFQKAICAGDRVKGTIQYAGASRTSRDCLAEGTLIAVKTAAGEVIEKPIESVLISDSVWDGIEWVPHEGVVCKGEQDVVEYGGICATPDHVVYLEGGKSCHLFEAKLGSLKLWESTPKNT
jgi:DNA polymerase